MATNTYVALDKVTADGTSATITFTSIPSTYTDLVLIGANVNSASSGNTPFIRFNSDSGTNYSGTILEGNGTSAQSGRRSNNSNGVPIGGTFVGSNSTAYNFIVQIMNYANTTTYKTTLARYNNSAAETETDAGLWRSTSAITSLTIRTDGGANWSSGSTFSLYGIATPTAESTPKATGGIVYSDSSYYYHKFLYSGTFTPLQSLSCDVLVVAAGGGAGSTAGGGGGAGGLRVLASQSVSTAQTVTVGGGGAGGAGSYATAASGGNTSFGSIAATGGGGGGGDAGNGANGGSGGAGGGSSINRTSGGSGNAGSYSPVEGYGGGYNNASYSTAPYAAGGGGGAGGAGQIAPATNQGGYGGVGVSTYNSIDFSTWLSVTSAGSGGKLAGGGGGATYNSGTAGAGGTGGGGTGGVGAAGTSGVFATGGGAGGGGVSSSGGNGGSGIVIVRYAK